MDCEKTTKTQKHIKYGCKMEGAIMMSNRATKQECLAKKLFGLPPHMINFTERIKAGMLLFLFEYEERKLYGVFEATTDGALNIVPNAFNSLGKSFPAQVLFRRVWMCRPLSEDEFCHAIIDNYYSPKKFEFSLSYDQVFKLVQLFSLRIINVKQNLNYVPNKIIRMFRKDYSNNGKSSRHFEKKNLKPHELQLNSKASLVASINGSVSACSTYDHHSHLYIQGSSASSLEISPLFEDPVYNVDSSNAADVSFERYDSTNPIGTFIQESNSEVETNFSPSDYICPDKNALKSVEYNGYPLIIEPKLRSDVEVKRTSVFSRLSSMHPNAATKRKSFSGSDKMAESSKKSKKLDCNTNKRSTTMFLRNKSAIDVDAFIEESIAEARLNLKKIRETEMNVYSESGGIHVGTLNNPKKLELLSTEERNIPVDGFNKAEAEAKVGIAENGDIDDGTFYNHKLELLSSEERKKPVNGSNDLKAEAGIAESGDICDAKAEAGIAESGDISDAKAEVGIAESGDINDTKASDSTEKGFSGRKKEVRSRNLLWFLQKSNDVKTSILDAAAYNEQTECSGVAKADAAPSVS